MLAKGDVNFLVVGGIAVSFNGFDRATVDVDILVEPSQANLVRLLKTLSHFGEGFARELKPEDFVLQEGSVRIGEHFDLDIFVQMKGLKYHDMIKDSRQTILGGKPIHYLNSSQLIFLKKDSCREKDRLDVQALTTILKEQMQQASNPAGGSGLKA
ncbi:MAG: hypothetical protein PHV34_23865 [Verrucomicrobiae bacterium]|nr:hypothetical protein [Verrucomicrobiae bacterium]